jgi:HEAT repeat protein
MNKYSEEKLELRGYGFSDQMTDLLERLVSLHNYHEHISAKHQLEKQGKDILPVMHTLTESGSVVIRKEAMKLIKLVGDRSSIPYAIRLLEDIDGDIRWIAAETLIHIGRASLRPLLKAVHDNQDAYFLREGAHHVLSALIRDHDPKDLRELQRILLNGELLETLPLRISKLLESSQI